MIQGGQAMNSVAEQASINIDIRYTDPDEFGRKMLKIHDIAHDMGIEMEEIVNGSSCHLDKEHDYTKLYLDCIKDVTGIDEVQYTRATGGSDGRFFYENGMKVIVHQPTSGAFHSPEEWVNKESLFMYEEIVVLYIERFASQIK
jgi:succinyl-diaminopimelate desuccinylase